VILSVDPTRALPVYEQIREQVTRMVAAGTLSAGTKLPTIRQLAADLGLAKGTIARAYELLEADAVILSSGRRGTMVRERQTTSHGMQTAALDAAAESLVIVARQIGADETATMEALRRAWQNL
jgi:DNA-binding transcriptional regulator YhcF (GntR family)